MQTARERWNELTGLLDRADRSGMTGLSVPEVKRLCRLYRHITIDLSRERSGSADPDVLRYLNHLAARAHGYVYSSRPVDIRPLGSFLLRGFPRLVRRCARPILVSTALFGLTALASFVAVVRQPETAYSIFDPDKIEFENLRLEKQEGEYKGNFTFSLTESPFIATIIILNNIRVAMMAFAFGALCCLPGALLLVFNGRMLGALSGVTWNHHYFLDFCSLILTHGILELTAICIAGGAGLMLGWSVIAPGELSRRDALRGAAGNAFGLLAGTVFMLIIAGIIEAHVTPHFGQPVRWGVAGLSAFLFATYVAYCGRTSVVSESTASASQAVLARTLQQPAASNL